MSKWWRLQKIKEPQTAQHNSFNFKSCQCISHANQIAEQQVNNEYIIISRRRRQPQRKKAKHTSGDEFLFYLVSFVHFESKTVNSVCVWGVTTQPAHIYSGRVHVVWVRKWVTSVTAQLVHKLHKNARTLQSCHSSNSKWVERRDCVCMWSIVLTQYDMLRLLVYG